MEEIENLRKKIDEINNEILSLLSEREKICKRIGEIKKQDDVPVVDEKREEKMLSKLKEKAREKGLDEDYVIDLFKLIISHSRRIEEK